MPSGIFGNVWNDYLPDGILAAGEPPVAAVTLVLEQNGTQAQVQTNGIGDYSFANLAPGLYSLRLIPPAPATVTSPQSGPNQTVSLGNVDVHVNFGLQLAPSVPANADVTNDPAVQQMPSVAVNPLNANHVVMAYMDYGLTGNGYAGIGVRVSFDGGANWSSSSVPLQSGYGQAAGHPIVQFDAQGRVFISFMATTFLGKDSNGTALNPGLIYDTNAATVQYLNKSVSQRAFGMQANNGIFVARSDNGGLGWTQVTAVASQRYDATFTTGNVAVALGATATITPAQMPANLLVNKTLIIDEGMPSMERVAVTAFTATTFTAKFNQAHNAGFTISVPVYFDTTPDLAIDTNPASPHYGNLYATWTRFYPAGQFPGRAAISGLLGLGGSEVMFAVSSDSGNTWTTRLQTAGTRTVSAVNDPFTGAGFLASPPFAAGTFGTGGSSATATEGSGTNTLPRVTVGPEGGVYVSQFGGGRFPVFYSTNAGATFRNPVPGTGASTIAPGYPFGLDSDAYTAIYPSGASAQAFFQTAPLFNNQFRVQSVRSITADPTRPGTIYAVEAVPILNTSGVTVDAGEIIFSRSTDFGVTWQLMTTVGPSTGNLGELPANLQFRYRGVLNDDNGGRFTGFDTTPQDEVIAGQTLPQLSVDSHGNIAVVWYDTRRDPGNKFLDVYGTISTDGGVTFSANNRITSASFNADDSKFKDARNIDSFYLGDRIGVALAGGKVYAAWTEAGAGDQDIHFANYAVVQAPFNDRFEANDTPQTATDLGTVTVQRGLPRLSLTGNDQDWFRVKAGATGQLLVAAGAPAAGAMRVELWDATGTNKLADGSALIENGQVIGVQVDYQAPASEVFLVRVSGDGVPSYSLTLQALTADLGTRVQIGVDGIVASGASNVYRLVAGVGGVLQIALTSGAGVQGNLNVQVLASDGQTVLAQGTEPGAPGPGEVEQLRVPVSQGQEVLVKVLGATTAALARVSVSGTPVVLGLGTPGPAINFPTPGAVGGVRSVTLQALGSNPMYVRIVQKNAAGQVLGTQNKLLTPGTPVVVTLVNTAGTYDLLAMDTPGSGSFHLDITNLDAFQSGLDNLFFPASGSSSAVATGDVNGDGVPDLVLTSTQGSDHVQVLLGNTDGTFQAARQFAVGAGQEAISAREPVLADFTGDGILDLVVPNYYSADVSLLVGRGDGTFEPQRRFDAVYKANSVASADFNGDRVNDLAVLDRNPGAAMLSILMGRSDGTFVPPQKIAIPFARGDASPVRAGDLDGDGRMDLAVFGANDALFQVLKGNGNGTFTAGDLLSTGEVLFDAQLADLNGDGYLDVVIGGGNTGSVVVRLGNGDGTFQDPQQYLTAPRRAGDNIGVIGLAIADIGSVSGPADGLPDIVVTARYRSGSDVPQAFFLRGIAPDANGRILAPAVKLGTLTEAGKIAVDDFDNDGFKDVAITESGGIRILYGEAPVIVQNTTQATARELGTVSHHLGQPHAIVPGFTDAYFTLQVPDETHTAAVDQVVDISVLFQNIEAAGLQAEVIGASRIVDAVTDKTGARFRVVAAQGSTLTVHVSSRSGGYGTYTLDINVLPQVISAQALAALPGGPLTSLVLTLQGDRLDPVSAQDPNNYTIRKLADDGVTPIGAPIPLASAPGTHPIICTPGANVDVSSGRTFPTTVRQTITLLLATPLTAGAEYLVELAPAIQTADLNRNEAGLLAHVGSLPGHPMVSQTGLQVLTGGSIHFTAQAPTETLDDLGTGTTFLTQTQNDLVAYLDFLLKNGDNPNITEAITSQLVARFAGNGLNTPFLILWLDPVNIRAVDPNGNRTTFNMQTNAVTNTMSRSFIEVGGSVEVMVVAAVPGTYALNVSDVQATARGGAILLDRGEVRTANLTDAMRNGETDFQFRFAQALTEVARTVLQLNSPDVSLAAIGALPTQSAALSSLNISDSVGAVVASLIPPDFAISLVVAIQNFVQSPAGESAIAAENERATVVARWLDTDGGRAFLRGAETLFPDAPVQEISSAFVDVLLQSPAYRLFRALRSGNGLPTAPAPGGNPPAPQPPMPENEQGLLVPEEHVERVVQDAGDVANDEVQPPAHRPTGKIASLIFAAVAALGVTYAVAYSDKERRTTDPRLSAGDSDDRK